MLYIISCNAHKPYVEFYFSRFIAKEDEAQKRGPQSISVALVPESRIDKSSLDDKLEANSLNPVFLSFPRFLLLGDLL